MTLERGSRDPPSHPLGDRAEIPPVKPPSRHPPCSFFAREALGHDFHSCAHGGAPRQFTRREGKTGRQQTAPGSCTSGSPICPPFPSSWEEGMDSSWALPLCRRAPLLPSLSVGWGLYPRLWGGGMKEEMGQKDWLGLFPHWGLGASGPLEGTCYPIAGGTGLICLPPGLTHLPHSTCCQDRLISAHHFGVAERGPQTPPSLSFVVPARRSSFISPFPAFGKQLGNV